MKSTTKLATVIAAAALGVAPALALATPGHETGRPTTTPANNRSNNTNTPGPKASLPAKAKAYGRFCKGESKTHVAGIPGTPFSKCVTDMAKLANGSSTNPHQVCKNESKKHEAGKPGTPYSRCVSGAAKLLKEKS
jgi:hypothetical protein